MITRDDKHIRHLYERLHSRYELSGGERMDIAAALHMMNNTIKKQAATIEALHMLLGHRDKDIQDVEVK